MITRKWNYYRDSLPLSSLTLISSPLFMNTQHCAHEGKEIIMIGNYFTNKKEYFNLYLLCNSFYYKIQRQRIKSKISRNSVEHYITEKRNPSRISSPPHSETCGGFEVEIMHVI